MTIDFNSLDYDMKLFNHNDNTSYYITLKDILVKDKKETNITLEYKIRSILLFDVGEIPVDFTAKFAMTVNTKDIFSALSQRGHDLEFIDFANNLDDIEYTINVPDEQSKLAIQKYLWTKDDTLQDYDEILKQYFTEVIMQDPKFSLLVE